MRLSLAVLTSLFLIFSFLAISTMNVYADDGCASQTSDSDILQCPLKAKQQAEASLNSAYSAAKKRVNDSYAADQNLAQTYLKILLDSQRGWLKFRDGQCRLEAFLAEEGTSANNMLESKCMARMDNERVTQLAAMPYQ